jgi:hypothetical protein
LYWWSQGRRDDLRYDFELAADFGLTQLQLALPWGEFQDRADRVPAPPMRSLEMLLDEAAEYSIRLRLTLLSVRVGGLLWLPHWALDPLTAGDRQIFNGRGFTTLEPRRLFEAPQMIEAQELVVGEIVGEFCMHPAAAGWVVDGGLFVASSPGSAEAFERWLDVLVTAARRGGRSPRLSAAVPARDLVRNAAIQLEALKSLEVRLEIEPNSQPKWAEGSGAAWPAFLASFAGSLVGTPVMVEVRSDNSVSEAADAGRQQDELRSLAAHGAAGAIGPLLIDPAPGLLKTEPYRHGAFSGPALFRADGSPRDSADVWRQAQLEKRTVTTLPSRIAAVDAEMRQREPELTARESFEEFVR